MSEEKSLVGKQPFETPITGFSETLEKYYQDHSSGRLAEKGGPLLDFFLAFALIGISLPMIWMNERRQVAIYKLIQRAKGSLQQVDIDDVSDANNYALV